MANIELPICNGIYSSDPTFEANDTDFLPNVMKAVKLQYDEYRQFFVGLCYNCYLPGSLYPLQRCSGCQLVSYCSRECQKKDRSRHKYVCKEFPAVNGKNVLFTKVLNIFWWMVDSLFCYRSIAYSNYYQSNLFIMVINVLLLKIKF